MRGKFILGAAMLAISLPAFAAPPIDVATARRIDRILTRTPLIDGHNDLPEQLREHAAGSVAGLATGTETRATPLMTDMARLRAGRVGGQFWSVYISGTVTGNEAVRQTIEQIDVVHRMIAAYPRDLALASTADDIVRIHRRGRIASLIGIEGGRQIGGSLPALRLFHGAGVRYMTLTHNQTTEWADSATDEARFNGLSPFGLKVVAEMNRLGMLVDLSHVSPAVMRQAITASRAPVIFSHSSAAAIDPHPRNVPDDVLRMLRTKGGVVMVNVYPPFVSADVWRWDSLRSGEEARLKAIHRASKAAVTAGLKAWEAANPRPAVTIAHVADHIDHIARVAGHNHVGLGADLDGIPYTPVGFEGADAYPRLFAELIRRGWSDANLAKLAGGNTLAALRGAEATARSMADVPPATDTLEVGPVTP
jgi:membrane dipeptidase